MDRTSVKISKDTREAIYHLKRSNESYDEFFVRAFGLDSEDGPEGGIA